MPPKRKSKALADVSTPKASATPGQDDDAMDIDTPKDTPKASETPRVADTPITTRPNLPPESEVLGDYWTEDQISSLFKAIMRWKPSGMHKHFRIIAISEHLRNHGFDPDIETHTRIPGIWVKLRQFFDMEMIDERDNSFDYVGSLGGDGAPEEIYKDFGLPPGEFHDLLWARAAADENEPDNWTDSDADVGGTRKQTVRKRKRGDTITTTTAADAASVAGSATVKTRGSSTVEDTDQGTPAVSSPVSRSARGARSQKRAAAKAKTEESDQDEEEEEDDDDDNEEEEEEDEDEDDSGDGGDDSSEEEEEAEAPTTRLSRSGSSRGRGRGRGRPKGGRKKT